ncbi:MAG: CDP-alcohol phosphatidyltransferase family protein [Candidatus Edwardsbacteria bacterium]|nr:CDP-alcohol phosphatidyltransferase family protein [Candidatus Edwardsbacteria bacterium]MBU1577163.1 CDP-alcohol phosphatidyltransferase family protein [Candidatus Edwardsbacteria bacterium]MBU2464425.1 CDP-alcohol phosphatidyltransferase family protein [Candidatus Edwardsbacteria bacterium]MBU2593300.1 CDP-alcohol phosphatidyltransferase family protein [Candidatus Edwardsbacteria bacterium]
MANLITLFRFALLFGLVVMAYQSNPYLQLANMPLLVVVLVLDAVDGYVARKRNESSLFGAIFDIIVDRVVENVLWIVLADLRLVPVWVAIVFITRSLVVDSIRRHGAEKGQTPFGMAVSRWAKFLVAGRFMRGLYGALKAVVFGWIFLLQPWPKLLPVFWGNWQWLFTIITGGLVYVTVAVCILRSIPVIAEFIVTEDIFAPFRKIRKKV